MVRFRLFGIPFEVGPYFWILSACLGSNVAYGQRGLILLALWVACVFVSIVVHELGHALVARHFGMRPYVALHWLGGTTFMPGASLTRPQAMLVTLAGPVAGLGLWLLAEYFGGALIRQTAGERRYITFDAVHFLVFINLIWTLFNLLPILPLDGGQFVRSLLGPRHLFTVRMIGGTVATIACVLCLTLGFNSGFGYTALFLGMLAISNFRNPASPVI
jgi:stage IV sporulation protein FB